MEGFAVGADAFKGDPVGLVVGLLVGGEVGELVISPIPPTILLTGELPVFEVKIATLIRVSSRRREVSVTRL